MSMDNYPPIKKFTLYTDRQTEVGTNTGFIMDQSNPNIPRMENPPPPPPKTKDGIEWEQYHNEYRRLNDAEKVKWKAFESIFKWIAFAIAFSFFCMTVN